jgi:hypothetical protein
MILATYISASSAVLKGPWGGTNNNGVKNRYLGLKFTIDGETHYGWARLTVAKGKRGSQVVDAILTGYAYETVANKPLYAGVLPFANPTSNEMKRQNDDAKVMDAHRDDPATVPGSLGLLARGAEAISIWRERE